MAIQGPYGGNDRGDAFDDGIHETVRNVIVGEYEGDIIRFINFEYVAANGNTIRKPGYGLTPRHNFVEFVLDTANSEYLKSVEGTYDDREDMVSSLIFTTSTGRKSQKFGKTIGTSFILKNTGFKIVGFLGRSSNSRINSLGAHFAAALVPPVMRLEFNGPLEGFNTGDDGVHDKVLGIKVAYTESAVCCVQYKYRTTDEPNAVKGKEHGYYPMMTGYKNMEFKVEDSECLTSVEGYYVLEPSPHVKTLKFTTNKGRSQVFGKKDDGKKGDGKKGVLDGAMPFNLKEEDHQIVGFFNLDKFGVYVKPI